MSVLKLPAFIAAVLFLFYSEAVAAMVHKIQIFNFKTARNDMFEWADTCRRFFGVRVLRVGRGTLHKAEKVVYMCNHRSWADFFMDCWLTEGRGAFMSRRAVAMVFPCFIASAHVLGGILLFKRGSLPDKKLFNKWVDEKLAKSANCRGLLVYPEGTRSTAKRSLPLKRGMLYYAHSRALPVQVVISTNKEAVLSEKQTTCGFGKVIKVGYSEVIEAKEFADDFGAFWEKVSSVWHAQWEAVYGADPTNLPLVSYENPDTMDLPTKIRVQQCVISTVTVIIMLLAAATTAWTARAMVESLGDFGKLLAAIAILLTAASFAQAYSGPVHAPLLGPEEVSADGPSKKDK